MRSLQDSCNAFSASDFLATARPIVWSDAFQRLRGVTFLGILSPDFAGVHGHPLAQGHSKDHTRAHHSVKVALLAARMMSALGLSEPSLKYATAWGLLHDIATWPLSHTGEAAFADATTTSAEALRRAMLTGDKGVGPFSVLNELISIGLDPDLLLTLFSKTADGLDEEMTVLHQFVHSPLTPDTLEGMSRSGRVLGIDVPDPELFICAFDRDLVSGVRLKEEHSRDAFSFWRSKSRIYSKFINRDAIIEFESSWSRSISEHYVGISLVDSLCLTEKEIVDRTSDKGVTPTSEVVRYKAPLKYGVADRYKNKRVLKEPMAVDALSKVFIKSRS